MIKFFKKSKMRVLAFVAVLAFLVTCIPMNRASAAIDSVSVSNRYNIVILLDCSSSMRETDGKGLRYEAIQLFMNMLPETGNKVGFVAFGTKIKAKQELTYINSQSQKDAIVTALKEAKPTSEDWTNTGDGLVTAVNLLNEGGDPNLDSVIIYFSDGNTKMESTGTGEATLASIEKREEAVYASGERGIKIYPICLNSNGKADINEMADIAVATGGQYSEVKKAQDLDRISEMFFSMIFGTETIKLEETAFGNTGRIETPFEVPSFGVEEINVIIRGKLNSAKLFAPVGSSKADYTTSYAPYYTFVKARNVVPGQWTLVTEGIDGEKIEIDVVYNTNIGVEVKTNTNGTFLEEDTLVVDAYLKSGNTLADDSRYYEGYSAVLKVTDNLGRLVKDIPMDLDATGFHTTTRLENGDYKAMVIIKGQHTEKGSNLIPITVSYRAPEATATPTQAPAAEPTAVPTEAPVATPTPEAVPEKEFNPLPLIIILGLLVIAAVSGVATYFIMQSMNRPYNGTIHVSVDAEDGTSSGDYTPDKGRVPLSYFNLEFTGLDNGKSFFTVNSDKSITLHTDRPVKYNRENVRSIRIKNDGLPVEFTVGAATLIEVSFEGLDFGEEF